MWIVSKSRLREFWERPGLRESARALVSWYDVVCDANWQNWSALKETYRSADLVGDCVVFDLGGNKYRLIARVRYNSHKVYVLRVMTHREYDRANWQRDCGCFKPPPLVQRPHDQSRVSPLRRKKK